MQIIYNNNTIVIANNGYSIKLEIAFNLTPKGHIWSHIGDALYYFKDITLTDSEQFEFIRNLLIEKNIPFHLV
jgi:hypothetical protein